MAYKITLLSTKVYTLRAANKALNKRRRAKKTRVRQGGAYNRGYIGYFGPERYG